MLQFGIPNEIANSNSRCRSQERSKSNIDTCRNDIITDSVIKVIRPSNIHSTSIKPCRAKLRQQVEKIHSKLN